jgi:NhaP-type Na+/H+ or K+/H+ antiporter
MIEFLIDVAFGLALGATITYIVWILIDKFK